MKVISYLETKIGERVSIKMIDEIRNLYDPTKKIDKELNNYVRSKIWFWVDQKTYTMDVLEHIKQNYDSQKHLTAKRLTFVIKRYCDVLEFDYKPIKNPKRGFFIEKVV